MRDLRSWTRNEAVRNRIQISEVRPCIDGGRFAAKSVVGEAMPVSAVVFREGHAKVAARARVRMVDDPAWTEVPLVRSEDPGEPDTFHGTVTMDRNGAWLLQVVGWTDHYASWLDGLVKKHRAGIADLEMEMEEGARILESHAAPAGVPAPVPTAIRETAAVLRQTATPVHQRVDAARHPDLLDLLVAHPDQRDPSMTAELPVWVDRDLAGFSTWYEMFPRSVGSDGVRSGTFAQAQERLGPIAAMGFDVLYLPPIHPIGETNRKGPNNTLHAGPDDPGVPWAIGSADGGHTAVHPDLGTIEDFVAFREAAEAVGLEVALDFAIQCSPDHPWVTEHPEWFAHRPDGSIQYAENPPKKYQDIFPIDFDTVDIEGLTAELKAVLEFWIGHGVKVFRVDNPHTKALPFWEWVIAEIRTEHPEVLFLAEAFTRPAMMHQLAKLGFTQSYTYFTWRTAKHEISEYLEELAHTDAAYYFRPNFWPNTPDILHASLQSGAPAAFKVRYALAGLTSPNMGMYSGYELLEHVPVRPGSEEYLDSEKYAYRPRNFDVDWSIAPFITRINEIRRVHRDVFGQLRNLVLHHIGNDHLLAFSKASPDRRTAFLVVANLDPHHPQEGWTWVDEWHLGVDGASGYDVEDLLTGARWTWHGAANWVRLDPGGENLHVFRIHRH